MPADPLFAEFESHQELLLPHTAAHLGLRNLDVGCGSGVASVIHTARLGLSPTLADVIDIRHPPARALPFRLIKAGVLPFEAQDFDSSYVQYVLHHLPGADAIATLLNECVRVSATLVIVEEVTGPKTGIARARAFAGAPPVAHSVVSMGSDENGWLETHVFVGRAGPRHLPTAILTWA